MTSRKEVLDDLYYCRDMLARIVRYTEDHYSSKHSYESKHTVIQNDITHLRRELMNVYHKLNPAETGW